MDDRLRLAVKNNAQWCDLVCRAAGIATTWQTEFWVAGRSTPRFYPEAITLQTNLAPAELIAALPAGRCSIKVSFADLDLGDDGFQELFTARWFYREPSTDPVAPSDWTVIHTASAFAEWLTTWGLVGVLAPSLVDHRTVRILERRRGHHLAAGAILNQTGPVVGLSNVCAPRLPGDVIWNELAAYSARQFPACLLVGYERDDDLDAAVAAGFSALDPLRIWLQRPRHG